MFDGNYKTRKRINLGNKKKETPEDLYKRVREERAERQRLKEETRAALTVQTLFRRRRDTARAHAAVEADLDATLRGIPQGTVLPLGALRRLLAQYNFLERTCRGAAEFDVQRGVKVAVAVAACIRAGPASSELLRALLASSASATTTTRLLSECECDDTLEFFQVARLCANLFCVVGSKSLFVAKFAPLAKLVLWVVQSFVTPRMVGSETLARNLSSAMLSALRGNLFSCVVRRYVGNAVSTGTWPVADMVSAILCELSVASDNVTTFTTSFVFDFVVKYDSKVTEKLGLNVPNQISKLLAQGDPVVYAKRVNRKNCCAFFGLVMNVNTEAPEDHSKEVFRLLEVLLSKCEKVCPATHVLKGFFQGSVRNPAAREGLFELIAQRIEKEDGESSEETFALNTLLNAAVRVVMRDDSDDESYEQHNHSGADTSNINGDEGLSTTLLAEFVGHPALFSIIWHKFLYKKCSTMAHLRGTESTLPPECMRLLWLWVRAAEVRVGSMNDAEFYGDGVPCGRVLSGTALSDAISILSYIVWKLFCWTPSSSSSSSYFSSSSSSAFHISNRLREGLRNAGARLLRALYDKNCRREFCADSAWTVEMASTSSSSLSGTAAKGAVMQEIPFVTPFSVRVGVLQAAIAPHHGNIRSAGEWESFDLYVTRDSAVEDTRAAFLEHGPSGVLRKFLRVEFAGEEGVDGGGLRKELLGLVARDIFGPDRGLFVATAADGALYPSPDLGAIDKHRLDDYYFAGMLVGVCIVNNVLVDIPFARFFLERMRGCGDDNNNNNNSSSSSRGRGEEEEEEEDRAMSTVAELATLDPEFARQLMSLRGMTPEDVAELDLTFTIDSVSAKTGAVRTFELAPGGAGIPVTAENRLWYIAAVANFRLNVEIVAQSKAFFRGLECVLPRERLRMFSPDELQRLVSGARGPIDIADWRANTVYLEGYTDDSQTICWFWEVVAELSQRDQAALLHFCTSCSRPPLLGFARLEPRFAIRRIAAGIGGAANRLPTASTCVNLLRIPEVQSNEQMRKNLSIIVQFPTGFQFG